MYMELLSAALGCRLSCCTWSYCLPRLAAGSVDVHGVIVCRFWLQVQLMYMELLSAVLGCRLS